MLPSEDDLNEEDPTSVEDEEFDQIYPLRIRRLSSVFWTPVRIAEEAARWLVQEPGTRVLDVGCGPGKFCLVAATRTQGDFTGVEQRCGLVAAAKKAATDLRLTGVEFIHANLLELDFSAYEAFYIFNPFEENMLRGHKIDGTVPLSPDLFRRYARHVAAQLGRKPLGTRVVTYMGYGDEIPGCYSCESTSFCGDLKLWIKAREHDADIERLGLGASRSYRGSQGWEPPRSH